MKTKIDFVTNSSSSSFIISEPLSTYERNDEISVEVKVKINLRDLIERTYDTLESFEKEYSYMKEGNSFGRKQWKKIEEIFSNGNVVHIITASDHSSNPIERDIRYNGLRNVKVPSFITIIDGEGEK